MLKSYVIQQKFRPINAHERLHGFLYFKIRLGLKDMNVLFILSFTKLWPVEEKFCHGFNIFLYS